MTKRETLRSLTIALSAATAVVLSGCGGGSSNTVPDAAMLEIPATMVASSLAPRYAETAADTLGSMDGMAFGPLSASIRRSYDDNEVSLSEDENTYVESIERDATGGFTVEFVVNGQSQRVDFTAAEFEDHETFYIGGRPYQIGPWRFSDTTPLNPVYFLTTGWYTESDGNDVGYQGHAVYGVKTRCCIARNFVTDFSVYF